MDQPLFGEKKKSMTIFMWISAAVVTILVAVTIVMAVVFGITRSLEHLVLGAVVLCFFLCCGLFFLWWKSSDLDPKFNWFMILLAASLIFLCTVTIIYTVKAPCMTCPGSFLVFPIGQPAQCSNVNITTCVGPTNCLTSMDGTKWFCNRSCNQTVV